MRACASVGSQSYESRFRLSNSRSHPILWKKMTPNDSIDMCTAREGTMENCYNFEKCADP